MSGKSGPHIEELDTNVEVLVSNGIYVVQRTKEVIDMTGSEIFAFHNKEATGCCAYLAPSTKSPCPEARQSCGYDSAVRQLGVIAQTLGDPFSRVVRIVGV